MLESTHTSLSDLARIDPPAAERSLDPDDWQAARGLAHRMLDDVLDHLMTIRERPVWRQPPPATREALRRPLPREGRPLEEVYGDFREHVLPYGVGNAHPRFWGWVTGAGTVTSMMADMLASGMNAHVAFGDQGPVYVELQVIRWLAELLGLPSSSSGVLASSGSVANLLGLAVARDARLPGLLADGPEASPPRPVLYCSDQVHNSVEKAAGLLGLGRSAVRRIPTDDGFRLDVAALGAAIAEDRGAGRTPFCVVANAGTVNTGALDDLHAVADVAAREGLWMHVDAAFGGAAALSPRLRPLLAGLERADSVCIDMHKWFSLTYDIACTLVRDEAAHRRPFTIEAPYLRALDRGIAAPGHHFADYGLDLSRGFRALKAWMCLQEYGTERYGLMIEQNVAQARYLAGLVESDDEMELLAPVALNVVCFRHRPRAIADAGALDAHNREILMELHTRGIAAPSLTVLRGTVALRAAIVNHRSRREDFAALVDAVRSIGRELLERRA